MTIITTCVFSSPISEHELRRHLNLDDSTHIATLSHDKAYDIIGEISPEIFDAMQADYCVQDSTYRKKQLLVSDMDSTIIGQECIDELADIANVKSRVSEITERAMAGELDFSASLIARVALLEGLSVDVLEQVWRERISLNKGARELVQTMKHHGAFTMLVSGGFTFFTERVAEAAGFDAHHANELQHDAGTLTGRVIPPILHSGSKRDYLQQACTVRGIDAHATLAVGDGANDKDMIEAASLGVAYYGKPYLRSVANAAINHTDLRSLLYFQGYSDAEIVR
jgi:phosphoserine phosphatase